MGSLSGLFDLTRQALAANQAALNATANNVANQNTAGYTREVANFSAGDTVTINGVQSSSGPQVTTTSVRDRVLEARVQQQMQAQSSTSAESDVLSQIQNVFSVNGDSTTAGSTAIGTALDSFFSSLTALAGDPADAATQQGVLSAANVVASTFNSAATQLQQLNASINQAIPNSVTAVNALTTTIAGLNKQIGEISPNGDAGALEDQRQLAIEQLSQYVGLDQITTQDNGITLTTQGGAVLVDGGDCFDAERSDFQRDRADPGQHRSQPYSGHSGRKHRRPVDGAECRSADGDFGARQSCLSCGDRSEFAKSGRAYDQRCGWWRDLQRAFERDGRGGSNLGDSDGCKCDRIRSGGRGANPVAATPTRWPILRR